ncbi:DNA-directed RNA polymerase subunit H [Candidatus Woesearchaeota archaeon]|nr:DNA-directed RNA polymerase subunit H [Candidatus Woesearchaeota archaeon]
MGDELIQHVLVPKHEKISDKEKEALLAKYNVSMKQFPKIPINDAALQGMDIKVGDIIKITRNSPTAGKSIFYRGVSSE